VADRSPEEIDSEAWLRRFHAARPGITSQVLARGGTYHRMAALVPPGARVLDLGAGDGYLCELIAARGARAIGVDFSREELARFQARVRDFPSARGLHGDAFTLAPVPVAARAQELPFAAGSFDLCVSHFAFMLMQDPPAVVRELARVLVPGGRFAALLGGGPVTSVAPSVPVEDAFHRFLALAGPRLRAPRLTDPRARGERGFRELFAGWSELSFERWEVDLGGSFDEVWSFLDASYQLPREAAGAVRAELAASVANLADPDGRIPCRMVAWLGTARAPASS
jgi:SAM-dependent methyltransferase